MSDISELLATPHKCAGREREHQFKLLAIGDKLAKELQEYVSQDEDAGFYPFTAWDALAEWNQYKLGRNTSE
ncbi:MAG: hypothetical protein KZQ99_04635 [Candidatus Thiodiazotropha sp. (ex Dulcina madagascariensis)]|nr:hypothetical protein [Candidatus Thiodiazotropha sp. (ex Dulcina madagascariensis)]